MTDSSIVGKELSVITLDHDPGEHAQALSTNYLKVEICKGWVEANRVVSAEITGLTAEGLVGDIRRRNQISGAQEVHVLVGAR